MDFFGCVRNTAHFLYAAPKNTWEWFLHTLESSHPHLSHTVTSLGITTSIDAWVPTDSLGMVMKYFAQAVAHFSAFFRLDAYTRERFAQFALGSLALTLAISSAYIWLNSEQCKGTAEDDDYYTFCRWLVFGDSSFNTLLSVIAVAAAANNKSAKPSTPSSGTTSQDPIVPQPAPPEIEMQDPIVPQPAPPEIEIEMAVIHPQ